MSQRVEVEMDDEGRLVLPAPVRQQLGLVPGMTLVVEQGASDLAYLRVQHQEPRLVDKEGVLVLEGEFNVDLNELVQDVREQRIAELLRVVP